MSSNLNNQLLILKQDIWAIKLRYLWLIFQILLMLPALFYGYLKLETFYYLFPLVFLFVFINIKLHLDVLKDKRRSKFLNYQSEADLVVFILFLLLCGGTQNPFYPFYYILVFLIGLNSSTKSPWPTASIVFMASFSIQVMPYVFTGHSIISSQTLPYLLIQFFIPLITFFIARSLGNRLTSVNMTLERIQRKEDKMSRLKALGAMSAGLSHEFASPLHAAQLRIDRILRKWGEDEDVKECQLALLDCSKTLHLMTRVHRDISSTQYEIINQDDLESIILQWKDEHPQARIKLELTPFELNCPRLSFIQTVFNILDNAYEAQDEKPIIQISSYQLNDQNVISIKDYGPGFPTHVLERLGEPFNTHRQGGIGLGLYSSELFMNSVGGDLKISNTNQGSIVELSFL